MLESDYPLLPRAIVALIALGFLLSTDPAGVAPWFKRNPQEVEDAATLERRIRAIRRVKYLALALFPTFGALAFRRTPVVFWPCIGITLFLLYVGFVGPRSSGTRGAGSGGEAKR